MLGQQRRAATHYPPFLKPHLDPIRQRPEIRHALQFIVRQLDAEVMLQSRQQVESLQAVDPERLEEVIVGRKLFSRHFKVASGETQNFVKRLLVCSHRLRILVRGCALRADLAFPETQHFLREIGYLDIGTVLHRSISIEVHHKPPYVEGIILECTRIESAAFDFRIRHASVASGLNLEVLESIRSR